MLPRLYVLAVLRRYGAGFPLLLSRGLPGWVRSFVRMLHPDETIIWYDSDRQRVTAPRVIVPSMMHTDHNFHPALNLMVHELVRFGAAALPAAGPELLYLSRANVGDERIENPEEVESAMSELGFAVVHPQELPPEVQIGLFAGAKVIAGEYGSALHNALFAPQGARVIAINFFNNYQSRIARLRQHRLAFVPPGDGRFRHWRLTGHSPRKYAVDPAVLRSVTLEVLERGG